VSESGFSQEIYNLAEADNARDYLIIDVDKGLLTADELFIMREVAKVVGQLVRGHGFEPAALSSQGTADIQWDKTGEHLKSLTFKVTLTVHHPPLPIKSEAQS
jgi:hypothetical protein